MDKIVIEGGYKLSGEVEISGAKNSALPAMAASLLAKGKSVIRNVPRLRDIDTFKLLLEHLGAKVEWIEQNSIEIDTSDINCFEAPYDLVRKMRASILVLGPLIAKYNSARISLPGGCAIGARPVNLHIKGMECLGADIELEDGYIDAKADKLRGCRIPFDIVTVTGTANVLMASSLAEGESIIENAAKEPEIVDLCNILKKMGAEIDGEGTETIKIKGKSTLSPFEWSVIPDRIETGTFIIAAAITGSEIVIKNCIPSHSTTVLEKLRETGIEINEYENTIEVKGNGEIISADIKTSPYPGFATDMQAQFMALMTIANGVSVISETVFENRFMHVAELMRMGADIKIDGHTAVVKGIEKLKGAPVMATDLRASASLILAGLAAEGETVLSRVYHIDRGYENIEGKLSKIGAKIKRIPA
ncbi:MAG: UDP-N-acetylglucosamine 1-carboxyvinyltransferase [Candidatus Schekmanbacteria bacterium]|nr:MAG: UDP-N-acetylglucosamine 1-carboxyvinyltransferase [Candidatus Schekmanbacteria bacterium]